MSTRGIPYALAAVLMLIPSVAYSQDSPATGFVVGPGNIGVIWQAAGNLALRPDFTFSSSSSDSGSSSYKATLLTVGVSALFYTRKIDNVRFFVSPRVAYTRQHSRIETDLSSNRVVSTGNAPGFQVTGVIGAECRLHRKFAVYGEAGGSYNHSTLKTDNTSISGLTSHNEQTGRGWGIRSDVGVVLYF